jgi:hypothetical protein
MVGKLIPVVDLREIWKHEALNFTSWLAENIDVLKEQLGLDVTFVEKEKSVGPFSVDILAKDAAGRLVIIENQLERTDHDHLGKVLTYLSNLDAKVAIWISSDPRPEHVTAIDFLNENMPSDTQFYLVKLEAFRIGDSDAGPLFTVEAGPSEERTAGGEIKKEFAEKDKRRYEFFEQLLERCNSRTSLFSNVSPVGYQGWLNAGAGRAGLMWSLAAMNKSARAELFFCAPTLETNKSRFEVMLECKGDIEKRYGEPLTWEFKDGRKQQYIRSICPLGGIEDESKWQAIQDDLVDRLVRMEVAMKEVLRHLE